MMKTRGLRIALLCIALLFTLIGTRPQSVGITSAACGIREEDSKSDRITRVLLLGKDRAASLADAIMLVTVDETTLEVTVLQIPRDTYAAYTEKDYKKINAMPKVLGDAGAKELLSRAFGVDLDYFITLELDALGLLVDAVGGVDIEVPQGMRYEDPSQGLLIDLPAGRARLNGSQAEQFVRYRAGYANADLGRMDAQKLFVQAFAQKCNSLTVGERTRLLGVLTTCLSTDVDLPAAIRFCQLLKKCGAEEVRIETLKGSAARGNSGAWYYVLNREGCIAQCNLLLKPSVPLTLQSFDPDGLFDRKDHLEFHNIYVAQKTNAATLGKDFNDG